MSPLDQKFQDLQRLYRHTLPPSLERIQSLLKSLGNPHQALPPVIHIAGTNGKGSTAAFLSSLLGAGGYRTHVYTSPHLLHVNERIALQGKPIHDELLLEALELCEKTYSGPLGWFELLTGAAFWAFAKVPAEALILETGLGGTFDATNVIERPLASVITSISLDHQDILGYTLRDIAKAKAGIFKKHVPVITALQTADVLEVLMENAWILECPFILSKPSSAFLSEFNNPLLGTHQEENLGVALTTLHHLKGAFPLAPRALKQGVEAAHWPGRLQKISSEPEIWIDGAHNEAGARALSCFIKTWEKKPILVLGMLKTKDPEAFLKPFQGKVEKVWTVPVSEESLSYDPEDLQKISSQLGFQSVAYSHLHEALLKHKSETYPYLISGSLRLVAEALHLINP